ncbi:hypothetical protein FNV43_RR23494 [Rhamnella rubrinervis]|uniref:K+ potassium transporter integral membrane domain-containing protein n=1 Tax=Rhamnella rubrinervis TaxID=2594499 RepID=A0A8K0E3X3_9ROSA|nr:hypothetical protein FNV43_RR23494 [Rhamnella rubrinervis]
MSMSPSSVETGGGHEEVSDQRRLKRHDSLDIESRSVPGYDGRNLKADKDWWVILLLAFQSVGIVYGDIGTSPTYVYHSAFYNGVRHGEDVLGVLSVILYTITLLPLVKYVMIVLRATDNGEGGTFALYSLICRYAKVSLTPSEEAEDGDVSNFRLPKPNKESKLKSNIEKSEFAKYFLLFATMLGTSMVIGDGILTPSISVLSAVGGIKRATSAMTDDVIVWISVAVLVGLFMVQSFGTKKVSYVFAPLLCLWMLLIGGIGLYNIIHYDPTILKAINPKYIVEYFRRNKKEAWISLGGCILSITVTKGLRHVGIAYPYRCYAFDLAEEPSQYLKGNWGGDRRPPSSILQFNAYGCLAFTRVGIRFKCFTSFMRRMQGKRKSLSNGISAMKKQMVETG